MRWRRQTRLPVSPLLDAARHRIGEPTPPLRDIADWCSVTERTLHNWLDDGVPYYSADAAACSLQLHPCLVWPEWWDVEDYDESNDP